MLTKDTASRLLWSACALLLCAACGDGLDTRREAPERRTLGEAFFGVLCERMGAQALPEDLTGASFERLCHRGPDGHFSERVDLRHLPPALDGAQAVEVARLEVLARRRQQLIAALDALFPEREVPVRDVGHADPALTCGPASPPRQRLAAELSALLGRMTALYGDGTLPGASRTLGTWLADVGASAEATGAWAAHSGREGYRPPADSLGLVRTVLRWPELRDLLDATTRSLGPGAEGGPARRAFESLLEVVHHELRTTEALAAPAPLRVTRDDLTGRELLSRPRTGGEALSALLLTEVPARATSSPGEAALLVRRDSRGLAQASAVVSPFVDADGDGLADADAWGRLVDARGTALPSPFPVPAVADPAPRDARGRALFVTAGAPLYATLDARHTLLAEVLDNARPLLATSESQPRSTVQELLTSAPVLFGSRDGEARGTRAYPPTQVRYDAFHPEDAAALELVHAAGQLLAEPTVDEALALSRALVAEHPGDVARLVGTGLALRRLAREQPQARLAAGATFRDDLLDVLVKVSREPGLLEDVLRALAHPDTLGLAPAFSRYMSHRDRLSYERSNLNGPPRNLTTNAVAGASTPVDRSQPDAGTNRSLLQRFLMVVHDARGVAFCNKPNAVVHANLDGFLVDLPLFGGTYRECEVFKVDDMAVFYLQSIVGQARLYLRPDILRNGFLGLGAADVDVLEDSSRMTGFWDGPDSRTLRPRPRWLNRVLHFDQAGDSRTGGTHSTTNLFLRDLVGPHIGSSVCTERIINDPDPYAVDASADGKVRGLRSCSADEWFFGRAPDTLIVLETEGFYRAITPLLQAFTTRNREDLFLELLGVLHRHWASEQSPDGECRLTRAAGDTRPFCSRAGAVRFEALVAEALSQDVLGGVSALASRLRTLSVSHCTSIEASTGRCLTASRRDGVAVMAELLRTLIDPARADASGLADRRGVRSFTRQDGTTQAQTTHLYLLLDALDSLDEAFARHAAAHPGETDTGALWSAAWSRLTDQFLTIQGEREASTFANPLLPRLLPRAIDVLRAQWLAHCPASQAPPYPRCAWVRDELTKDWEDAMRGPAFATAVDFAQAVREDAALRARVAALSEYLLEPSGEAYGTLLLEAADAVQTLAAHDPAKTPLAHALAGATRPDFLVDSGLVLLERVVGKHLGADGVRMCSREMDPNDVVPGVLARLVTPMEVPGRPGAPPATPLELFTAAVVDLQRVSPGEAAGPKSSRDYQRISGQVAEFLLDPERGLERFYAVARKAGGTP